MSEVLCLLPNKDFDPTETGVGLGILKTVLMADSNGNEEFYKKLGFRKHKTAYALYTGNFDYLE